MKEIVRDKELRKKFYPHTRNIILFLILVYIIEAFLPNQIIANFITNPNDLFSIKFYTIITSIFLHKNIYHLFSNLVFLYIFGRVVEEKIGKKIYFIFLLAGIVSNIISHLIALSIGDSFNSLGASGAIAGLVSLAIFLSPLSFIKIISIPIPISIIAWFAIANDVFRIFLNDGINRFAHLGGYVGVVILSYFLEKRHIRDLKKGILIQMLILALMYFALNYFNIDIVQLLK